MKGKLEYNLEEETKNFLFQFIAWVIILIINTVFFAYTISRGIRLPNYADYYPDFELLTYIFWFWNENEQLSTEVFIYAAGFFILYSGYGHRIKKVILQRFGVKHIAEIIGSQYVRGLVESPFDTHYLEIAYTDSKGRERIYKTPGYHGNPNYYLKNTHCSIYEWKGLHAEGDFRVRDKIDPFGYIGINPRRVHFTLR